LSLWYHYFIKTTFGQMYNILRFRGNTKDLSM